MSKKLLSRRNILGLGLASLATPFISACKSKTSAAQIDRPNVILFLSDTLRADHLQCNNYPLQNSPEILKFSREAINLKNMSAAATWTKPSIASIMTGVSPQIHQMVVYEPNTKPGTQLGLRMLSDTLPTFDQFYQDEGYHTAWFLSNPHVVQNLGFGRGYTRYRSVPEESVEDQVQHVIEWIQNRAQEPFLAFVHILDPHYPYLCNDEQFAAVHGQTIEQSLARLPKEDADKLNDFHLLDFKQRNGRMKLEKISPPAIKHIRDLYDTEIKKVDKQFGRLISTLQTKELYDRTAVILTSDHGESFNEHGKFYHGNHLFDTEIHVPFLIRLPGSKKGMQLDWPVSQCSLCPSLLALLGIDPPQNMHAEPFLTPIGKLVQPKSNQSLSYLDFYNQNPEGWHAALVDWPLKVIYQPEHDTFQVFNRQDDPLEYNNIAQQPGIWEEKIKTMSTQLHALRDKDALLASKLPPAEYIVLEDEDALVDTIRGLGYF